MKRIKHGKTVDTKMVSIAKDLHWKVLASVASDLGFTAVNAQHFFGAIRNRNEEMLRTATSIYEPRSMLKWIGPILSRSYTFYRMYQLNAFLKKYPFTGVDTLTPAIATFEAAERTCKLFNEENYRALEALDSGHPKYLGVLNELRRDIRSVLREVPNLDSVIGHAKHGPGSSLGGSYMKGKVTSYYKWSNLPYTVTKGALPIAKVAIETDPRWVGALHNWYREKFRIPMWKPIDLTSFWGEVFEVVDGNKITTVPKTAVTDRTIAIEPVLNVFLQLGVDHVLKSALKRHWGYDLRDQQHNQILAKEGSINGNFATIDLSAASDSISLKICEMLLPPLWYDLLLDLRSPKGNFGDKAYTYDKISSMGNGYTFALESLIFGALVRCAIRRTQSTKKSAVYGDDIVIPSSAAEYLHELLSLCGFTVNDDKSFSSGPFRESCGADFFLGHDVRPVFLKRALRTVRDVFYIHNILVLAENRLPWFWEVDFSATKKLLRNSLPCEYRRQFYGPVSESLDTHLFSNERLHRNAHDERIFWTIQSVPKTFNHSSDFFFRKLMFQPTTAPYKWDWKKGATTGNAFDITKRGHTLEKCVRVRLP